jgi:hypothetical protein
MPFFKSWFIRTDKLKVKYAHDLQVQEPIRLEKPTPVVVN